ncbi:hypothetical protein STIAU_4314 [Stigmatella aurantiaca DW4/3-1]|uniref:Uncharacterized protein n=1 Tax=Stigmatella aurantiaca (strain DW4/3-1) TaxID=378806 RepID=Q090I6_STIAD|nr:hypothetical protein STIAU_4314 [Stigmatella aurantiaca DW4/3-1]
MLIGAAGCGDNILLQTSYSVRDTTGRSYGNGTGGGGQSYDTPAPQWPVSIPVAVSAEENTAEETPIIPIRTLTLTIPDGSACGVATEPDCSLICSFELRMDGPGACAVLMKADTEKGVISQCFSYALTHTEQFSEASDKTTRLCGD